VSDDDDLTPLGLIGRRTDRLEHPGLDLDEGLTPTRRPWVAEVPPVTRSQKERLHRSADPLHGGSALGDPLVRNDLQPVMLVDRLRCFLCTFHGACPQGTHIAIRQPLARCLRLFLSALGEMEARQAAVDNPFGVLDLTVTDQVDGRHEGARLPMHPETGDP
jgi:hypothetical protein